MLSVVISNYKTYQDIVYLKRFYNLKLEEGNILKSFS